MSRSVRSSPVILRRERSEPRKSALADLRIKYANLGCTRDWWMIGRGRAASEQAAPQGPSSFEGLASLGRLRMTGLDQIERNRR